MGAEKEASFVMRIVDLVTGPLKKITGAAGQAVDKLKQAGSAAGGLGGKLGGGAGKMGSIWQALTGGAGKFGKQIREAAGEVPGLNQVISMVTNPYVAIAVAVVALGVALVDATKKALEFERGMAQVNTTAQLGKPELGKLTDQLLDMGANSTVELNRIPSAFNSVISAVGDTDKALKIFEPSLKAAQAGFTDINVVTEAATNLMGSVGNALPTELFDAMFATMRLGKAEFKDIAAYLPKIIPLANNVGIKYQEIAGAFALMTGKGQTAEQAAMLLQNAMTALSKSEVIYGTKSQAGFIRSGIAIFDNAGKMRSLTAIVDDLAKKTAGMTDKQKQAFLNGLGLDAQASASFSVMAQNAGDLRKFVGGVVNSAGEMEEALGKSANRTDQMTILSNKWQRIMTKIGFALMPLVDFGIGLINSSLELVTEHSGGFAKILKVVAYMVAPVLIAGFVAMKNALAAIYVVWRLVNAAITFQFTIVKGLFSFLGKAVDWVWRKLGGSGSLMEKLFGGTSAVWSSVKAFFGNFLTLAMATLDAIDLASEGKFKDAGALMKKTWSEVRNGTAPAASKQVKSLDDFFGDKGSKAGTTAGDDLTKQNKGANIQSDKGTRVVNVRIDKIEVNAKVSGGDTRDMQRLGNQVADVIVGAVRDSEIILSTSNG